jgi:hypothetical protein
LKFRGEVRHARCARHCLDPCSFGDRRLRQLDPKSGYRPYLLIPKRKNNDQSTLFIMSFSGGGTRAAELYDEILFEGVTFADLLDKQVPVAIATGTDISTGARRFLDGVLHGR